MKLYLISDDLILRNRWMEIFSASKPIALSAFSEECEYNSVVFISDTLLTKLSDKDVKNLFLRRVMILSMIPDFSAAQRFLQIGAMGYGNAMMHETHLLSVFQALEEGKVWLHPDFIALMISQIRDHNINKENSLGVLGVLSTREREVALLLGNGATHQEVADELDITVRTVKAHATAIYHKLDVKDRLALSLLLHS